MTLAHLRRGSGEPLVLAHGLGATGKVWAPVIDRLAEERDVIAIDMPGFGGSDPLPAGIPPSAANMAAGVRAFCDSLGIEQPHVAGNSLGAWMALEMGKAGWAASVTALSPAGLWRRPLGPRRFDRQRWARRLRPLLSLALRTRRGRRALLATTFARPDRVPADAARELILSWVDSPAYEAANHEMRSDIFDPAGFPQIPVTIAWGEHDRLVAPPKPERRPPGSRFLVLEGCGHTPTWDDPELVAGVLLDGSSSGRRIRSPQPEPAAEEEVR